MMTLYLQAKIDTNTGSIIEIRMLTDRYVTVAYPHICWALLTEGFGETYAAARQALYAQLNTPYWRWVHPFLRS